MIVPLKGMTRYQGEPTHGTLRVEYLTRLEDGQGNASPGVFDYYAAPADLAAGIWRDEHNRASAASLVVNDLGVRGTHLRFTETFFYADRPAIENTYLRNSTPTNLEGTEYDYTEAQAVQLVGPSGVPLTWQAAQEFIGSGGTLLTDISTGLGLLDTALADIEQSTLNNNNATGLALQQLNDQTAVIVAAASASTVPVIQVFPFAELNQTGYPNDVSTGGEMNTELTWNVTGAAGATVLTYVAAGSAPIAQIGTQAWAANIKDDAGEYREYTVIGFDAGAGTITLNTPLVNAATAKPLRNSHYQNNHRTESGTRTLVHYMWRQSRRYTTARYVVAQFRGTDTTGPWALYGGLVNGGLTTAGDAKGIVYNVTRGLGDADLYPQKISSSVGATTATVGTNNAGEGAQWAQSVAGVRGHMDAWIGCRRGLIQIDVIVDGLTVYTAQMGRGLRRVRVPFSDAALMTIRVTQAGAAGSIAKIGNVVFYSAVGAQSGPVIPLNGKIVVAGDSWTQLWGQAFTAELQALITAAGGTATVFNVGNSGKTSRWATWWKPVWKAAHPDATFIYAFGVNDLNAVATMEAKPDGSTAAQGPVSEAEYRANLAALTDDDLTDGRQPIILHMSAAPGDGQTQGRGGWVRGYLSGQPLIQTKSDTVYAKTISGGGGAGAGTPIVYESAQPNSSARTGHLFKTMVAITGGNHLTVQSSTGVEVAAVRAVESRMVAGAFEATNATGDHFRTPNGRLFEASGVLWLAAQSGKTLTDIRINEKTRFMAPFLPAIYTVATLPSAAAASNGAYAQVSDPAVGKTNLVRSNGTIWQYVALRDGTAV